MFHPFSRSDVAKSTLAVGTAIVLTVPAIVCRDIGFLIYEFLLAPCRYFVVALLVMWTITSPRDLRRSRLLLTGLFVATSSIVLVIGPRRGWFAVDTIDWEFTSPSTLRDIATQTVHAGVLPHIEWKTWGILDWTSSYLVYDKSGNLSIHRGDAGKIAGVPCPVWRVERLARHWFIILTYTDTTWDECS